MTKLSGGDCVIGCMLWLCSILNGDQNLCVRERGIERKVCKPTSQRAGLLDVDVGWVGMVCAVPYAMASTQLGSVQGSVLGCVVYRWVG